MTTDTEVLEGEVIDAHRVLFIGEERCRLMALDGSGHFCFLPDGHDGSCCCPQRCEDHVW